MVRRSLKERLRRARLDKQEKKSKKYKKQGRQEDEAQQETLPPFSHQVNALSHAIEKSASYYPDEQYLEKVGETFSSSIEQAFEEDKKAREQQDRRSLKRQRQALMDELVVAQEVPLGRANQPLSEYEAALIAYHFNPLAAFNKWKKTGRAPRLPSGLADAFKAVLCHGGRANGTLIHRALKRGDKALLRKDGAGTFDDLVLYILANTDLCTRSFSLRGTQSQIGEVIGKSQATISRWLGRIIGFGAMRHAFIGDNKATDPRAGIVHDKGDSAKRNLNNVYVLTDEFGTLVAGKVVGEKLNRAFEESDTLAQQEGAGSLPARLAVLRATLWEGTIMRRNQAIGASNTAKQVQATDDRSIAANIILKKMQKQGLQHELSEEDFAFMLNNRLKYSGFSPNSSPPGHFAA